MSGGLTESGPLAELANPSEELVGPVDTPNENSGEDVSSVAKPLPKRKKKKKAKKVAVEASEAPAVTLPPEIETKSPVLCISRNKHWRYISSYHGPWLQLPVELLDSLLMLNLDPSSFSAPGSESKRGRNLVPASPTSEGTHKFQIASAPPLFNKPIPPPIDPGVFKSVSSIRRLIDEASDLAVRAASGLSTAALASIGNSASYSGSNGWANSQTLGLNAVGDQGGKGRNAGMSAARVNRLRSLAVSRLAAAYRADEIAASVMVMQGASALDDVAERVLKIDPQNLDAQYVQFFHEKIPSRQLAECTTTVTLDSLISARPQTLEYYRTRGVVRCFRDEYHLAIRDFTYALKEARTVRKAKHAHSTVDDTEHSGRTNKNKKGKKRAPGNTGGPSPMEEATATADDPKLQTAPAVHPSLLPSAPEAIEPQLLFHRGVAYLQSAVYQIEGTILQIEGITKPTASEGGELRLCYLERGRYGGVEIGNPDGPLGSCQGTKVLAYRGVLATPDYREGITAFLKKSIRDQEKFLSHFDTMYGPVQPPSRGEQEAIEVAFLVTESSRPGSGSSGAYPIDTPPTSFTTYHPLLVESHFTILLCHMMLGDFNSASLQFIKTAEMIDGLEGYPIFLPARSMAQAEFIEILERLASWRHSASGATGVENRAEEGQLPEGCTYSEWKDLQVALKALRLLLAPVAKRQRQRAEEAMANGDKKKPPINIPLHGPRVEIILAWLASTYLVDLEYAV